MERSLVDALLTILSDFKLQVIPAETPGKWVKELPDGSGTQQKLQHHRKDKPSLLGYPNSWSIESWA